MTAQQFPNSPESVTRARRMVTRELVAASEATADAAELMVSEMATNCVRHTDSDFTVAVVYSAPLVRIEVTDWADRPPVMRSPLPSEPSGRGLRIIDMLAERWGVEPVEPTGKTVWFELVDKTG